MHKGIRGMNMGMNYNREAREATNTGLRCHEAVSGVPSDSLSLVPFARSARQLALDFEQNKSHPRRHAASPGA